MCRLVVRVTVCPWLVKFQSLYMFICTYRLWNYLEKKTNKKAAASSTGMLRLLVASFCVPLLSWYYIRPLCVHAQRPFYCVAYRLFWDCQPFAFGSRSKMQASPRQITRWLPAPLPDSVKKLAFKRIKKPPAINPKQHQSNHNNHHNTAQHQPIRCS